MSALAVLAACAGPEAKSDAPRLATAPAGACSDLTRTIAEWQGHEFEVCPESTLEFRTLTTLGDGFLFGWVPKTGKSELWRLEPDNSFGSEPRATFIYGGSFRDNRLLVGFGGRLLNYHQKTSEVQVHAVDYSAVGAGDPLPKTLLVQGWPPLLGGRYVAALDSNHVLEWGPGSGSYGVVRYVDGGPPTFERFAMLGQKPTLRRGYRWLALGEQRLLGWNPGAHVFQIWTYNLDELPAGDILSAEPVASGELPELGPEHEILVVAPGKLGIWNRDAGTVEVRAYDPLDANPLSGTTLNVTRDDRFRSLRSGWERPTTSNVRHMVIVFQQGRSFDSYFGHYCSGLAGAEPCSEGRSCCEAMPELVAGVPCRKLAAEDDAYVPNATASCQVEKLSAWSDDQLVASATCGDVRDFVCAEVSADSPLAPYHELAREGTLADRYFASVAGTPELNMAYFGGTQFSNLVDATLIAADLADAGIPFAVYVPDLSSTFGLTPPYADDGSWAHFRGLEELSYDIETEQLPAIAIVIPSADSSESESAGDPESLVSGIEFTTGIAREVMESPRYGAESLIVLTHLGAGGFYDHVPTPEAPPASVDPAGLPYGSRVPFLALGPFVRKNYVFHEPLEHSSLTAFIEWNWFGSAGRLNGRDTWVTNLKDLLDPALASLSTP